MERSCPSSVATSRCWSMISDDSIGCATGGDPVTGITSVSSRSSSFESCFSSDRLDTFEASYEMFEDRLLGTGSSANVYAGACKMTGRPVAVKLFRKHELSVAQLASMRTELEIHSKLWHPGIVKQMATFESEDAVHVVMEHLGGGELYAQLEDKGACSETEVARIAVELLSALCYLHQMRIMHRDVKLENIVLARQVEGQVDSEIRLIDLGFAVDLDTNDEFTQRCGTVGYMAPEVILGQPYTEKADMWSAGAVFYMAATGNALYDGGEAQVLRRNRSGRVSYSRRFFALPSDMQDFLRRLLCVDASERWSAFEALSHPWLQRVVGSKQEDLEKPIVVEASSSPCLASTSTSLKCGGARTEAPQRKSSKKSMAEKVLKVISWGSVVV